MHNSIIEQLQTLEAQFISLESTLNQPNAPDYRNQHRRFQQLLPIVDKFREWKRKKEDQKTLEAWLNEEDETLHALANEELEETSPLMRSIKILEEELLRLLLPDEADVDRSCFLEIRAGTGGEEAALFASDLYRMYYNYAQKKAWKIELHDSSPSDIGGFKELILKISGKGAFGVLRHESGGHRVQRVPKTETQGRIHTSACTVLVLPESPKSVEIDINPSDLRIDTFRASGAGGQHVNKTDSAVRITHLPTGIVSTCQNGRSQHQNREYAMDILKARLAAKRKAEEEAKAYAIRTALSSSGSRTDRIRTYNFPQGRVTDHRIPITLYHLEAILEGAMEELIEPIEQLHQKERIAELQARLNQT